MKLIPWKNREQSSPALLFDDLDRDFNSMFNAFFEQSSGTWSPRLDVKETKDEIQVKADLPGMKKEDIEVSVDNGVLTISGERKSESDKEEGGWRRIERSYGSFQRSVALPRSADAAKVKADYKDGVLSVVLAKHEGSKPRTISIN